jgi:hypothetical protein
MERTRRNQDLWKHRAKDLLSSSRKWERKREILEQQIAKLRVKVATMRDLEAGHKMLASWLNSAAGELDKMRDVGFEAETGV